MLSIEDDEIEPQALREILEHSQHFMRGSAHGLL
jgi:hypothetical protein